MPTEAETRKTIDQQLADAGWSVRDRAAVKLELPVPNWGNPSTQGILDYGLTAADGTILAVVEAKRSSREVRDGEAQLRSYLENVAAQQAQVPFGFLANGHEIWFWEALDRNPRRVAGFFPREDLERLRWMRQEAKPLGTISIRNDIVNRAYQHQAVRRVTETFAENRRQALLVMATGTGKTRTTMALIDVFLRADQARKVLFLADRDELVKQALEDGFKSFLAEPSDRIWSQKIDRTKRLYVSTTQTMLECYQKFAPSAFDLIIFDEAHRSIFNRFTEVMEYFDARRIGLTATPAAYVDRDTFRTFGCEREVPTFLYSYEEAVQQEHLVDYVLYRAQTAFQRQGIRGVDLSEENQQRLIADGIDPDTVEFSGAEMEKTVSNRETLVRQWEEIMEVCLKDESGQMPGKTIVFAMSTAHANRLREVFENVYPQHAGMCQVITSTVEHVRDGDYGDGLITQFKKEEFPRIAISVDMLDTGIDVPEVVNLIFMKPVVSPIKLWQMIGRGTRNHEACKFLHRLPNGRKENFLILDFWENSFERAAAETPPPAVVPILVRLFNTRLLLLQSQLGNLSGAVAQQAITDLRGMIARIPLKCYPVQREYPAVQAAWTADFWISLGVPDVTFLRNRVAPLLRFSPDVDLAAESFTHKVERLKLQILQGRASAELVGSIGQDVRRLPGLAKRIEEQPIVGLALQAELATATPSQLTELIQATADDMRLRRKQENGFLLLDLPDFMETKAYVSVGQGGQQIPVEEYRNRVEGHIRELLTYHPTLQALQNGKSVTDEQLIALERTLARELGGGDVGLNSTLLRTAFQINADSFLGFMRQVLHLPTLPDYRQIVLRAFDAFITARDFTSEQIQFLLSIQAVLLEKKQFTAADFFNAPLTNYGRNAAERFLSVEERDAVLALAGSLAA